MVVVNTTVILWFYGIQIDALPEVVKAVNGKCEVYLDGGVRQGTDVLKAIAIGAKCVFIGRPAIYGLTYDVSNWIKCYISPVSKN